MPQMHVYSDAEGSSETGKCRWLDLFLPPNHMAGVQAGALEWRLKRKP